MRSGLNCTGKTLCWDVFTAFLQIALQYRPFGELQCSIRPKYTHIFQKVSLQMKVITQAIQSLWQSTLMMLHGAQRFMNVLTDQVSLI